MATQSSILAWKILWMEEPGGLQSMVDHYFCDAYLLLKLACTDTHKIGFFVIANSGLMELVLSVMTVTLTGPGILFFESFKITVSISLLVLSLSIFSISSWFYLGRVYLSKNLYIFSKDVHFIGIQLLVVISYEFISCNFFHL